MSSRIFLLMVKQHVAEHPAFGVADEGEEINRQAAEAAEALTASEQRRGNWLAIRATRSFALFST